MPVAGGFGPSAQPRSAALSFADLHVWALTSGRNSLTVHLVLDTNTAQEPVRRDAARMLQDRFRLTHTTIQVELQTCEQAFACGPHAGEHHHSH